MPTTVINAENIDLLRNLNLHDAEVSDITCNYLNHQVDIPLKLHIPNVEPAEAIIKFDDVLRTDISYCEPWGAGFYVFEVTADKVSEDGYFQVSILLNSGDKINVVTSKMTYSD